ncbi:hypothetical protein [Runella sp.]|uniref:hypothetical protein n=1 Tax=Runella sp. TaxID=1960881 RepID=UPI003D0A2B90
MQSTIFDYLGQSHTINGFRDMYRTFFQLIYSLDGGEPVTTEIEEPVNWADVSVVLLRHNQYHGFDYESLDDFTMASDCPAGKSIILAMYKAFGTNAKIIFQSGADVDSAKIVEHEGVLNMGSKDEKAGILTCDVETNTLQSRIQAKADTKVNLLDSVALDGTAVTAPTVKTTILHSKAFRETYQVASASDTAEYLTIGDSDVYVFPNLADPSKADIKTLVPGRIFGIDFSDPIADKSYFWKAFSDGKYTITISLNITCDLNLKQRQFSLNRAAITNFTAQPYLVHERDGAELKRYKIGDGKYNQPDGGYYGPLFVRFTVTGANVVNTLQIRQGDNVYLFVEIKYTYRGANELASTSLKATSTNFSMQIDGVSRNVQSPTKGLLAYDAIQQAIRLITGQSDCFRSSFLGKSSGLYPQDGDGANYLKTNGFQIRRFDKAVQRSFKELVEDTDAVFKIGYEYTLDNTTPVIRMEKAEFFYKGGEILRINEVSNLNKKVANELIYSMLRIGYAKYLDEGLNYLDEFNAYHEYSTPILNQNGQYQATSNEVASGYAIEATRREQFETSPKDSTRYDDDLFVISVNPDIPSYVGMATFAKNPLLFANRPLLLLPVKPSFCEVGVKLSISGTAHHNTTFTIIKLTDFGVQTVIVLDKFFTGEVVSSATIAPADFAGYAERNEHFSIVENLLEPETSYNLRITPKQNLLNHAAWLNSSLAYMQGDEVYKNTFAKLNGDLVTQLSTADAFPACNPDHLLLTEKADIPIENANRGKRIFSPDWITFNCDLSEAQFNLIRNALRGWNNDETDYGYLTITDWDGSDLSGYPFEVRRQKSTGKTSIKMLKTYQSLVDDQLADCNEYEGWTFADFEANPVPKSLEKCLMSAFG